MGEKAGHRSGKSRRESQSWVQPGPGSGDNSPERQKPLAFGSEEDGNVSRPVLNISLEASHDSVETDVSPRLQVPQRLPTPCRAHGEGLVLRGAFGPSRRLSATPPPATRSLGPAPRLGPPLTSLLPRPGRQALSRPSLSPQGVLPLPKTLFRRRPRGSRPRLLRVPAQRASSQCACPQLSPAPSPRPVCPSLTYYTMDRGVT